MNIEDIITLQANDDDLPFRISQRQRAWRQNIINNKIALPLDSISCSYDRNEGEVEILLPTGETIGFLCFTKTNEEVDLNRLTENEFVCLLTELPDAQSIGLPFKFNKDYLVINKSSYKVYNEKYRSSSSVWGGYTHEEASAALGNRYFKSVSQIQIPFELDLHNDRALLHEKKEPAYFLMSRHLSGIYSY